MPVVVACPACRTGLLARRGDALCPTCVKAAREMAPRPLWLFDSPLLRQALAEQNLSAVPAIVRAASGLSQRDLAAMVGLSGAALSYYERGLRDGMFDIRVMLPFADTVGMPRSALLPLIFADPQVGPVTCTACEAETGWPNDGGTSGTRAEASHSPSVPRGSHVRYWRACTDTLYSRDRAIGGAVLLAPALQQWRRARLAIRNTANGTTTCQILAAAGELAMCVGWIALDAGRLPLARRLYAEARKLAADAGDRALTVHALTSQSMLHADIAEVGPDHEPARRAVHLAVQAQEEGRYLPIPRLHVLIALCHASAAALLGDNTAFRAAITRARRELDRSPLDDDPPEWLRFVDDTEVIATEARGYLSLGDASRSALLYRQALASAPGTSDLGHACRSAGLAKALLTQGARHDAIAVAMQVLSAFDNGLTSIRCLSQLRPIRDAANRTPVVEEFRNRFDAIEQALVRLNHPTRLN